MKRLFKALIMTFLLGIVASTSQAYEGILEIGLTRTISNQTEIMEFLANQKINIEGEAYPFKDKECLTKKILLSPEHMAITSFNHQPERVIIEIYSFHTRSGAISKYEAEIIVKYEGFDFSGTYDDSELGIIKCRCEVDLKI